MSIQFVFECSQGLMQFYTEMMYLGATRRKLLVYCTLHLEVSCPIQILSP